MPRIPNLISKAVVFLYASEEEAYAGKHEGGTGFMVCVPFENGPYVHLYLITNAHCIEHGSAVAVRFNTPTKGIQIDSIPASDWTVHPDGDDVAVVPLDLESSQYELSAIPINIFMTEDQRMNGDFGAGDECFVVGRNIGLEGQNRNTPAARFGAVSMIDPEPIYQEERRRCQESFVVEAKSLGGYSGAPVFVYQSPPILEPVRGGMEKWSVVVHSYSQAGFAMLGITFGHIAGRSAITGPWHDLAASERAVAVNSGMMLIVPAWKIREILDLPRFVELREKEERNQADRLAT